MTEPTADIQIINKKISEKQLCVCRFATCLSLQNTDLTRARLQYLQCNNVFNGFSEPGIEEDVDDGVKTGVKIQEPELDTCR